MRTLREAPDDEDAYSEGRRLIAEERAEREPEMEEDSPLVIYCRVNPRMAASQISALQEAANVWATMGHMMIEQYRAEHHIIFKNCEALECRKLRDRLRPVGEGVAT